MEPDEDVAGIVRQIFEWAADGNTAAEITRKLYAMNIPTPGEYRRDKGKDHYNVSRTHGVWSSGAVLRMLEDQRYIGTYVIGKRKVQEIGSRRMKLKDESEWFKIPDHHPAIVSMELFKKANASIRRFSLPNKKRRNYLLRGKVFCGCCDHGALDGNRVKVYLKNSLYPLMYLFGKNSMPDVDNLLTSFYQLDDEARKEVVETIQFKLQYHKDKERAEQVKQIKGW